MTWSLCSWVSKMASRLRTPVRNICCLKSGPASMRTVSGTALMRAEDRKRWSRGSAEVQTRQSHPMTGTPCEVPVPSSVSFRKEGFKSSGRIRGCIVLTFAPFLNQIAGFLGKQAYIHVHFRQNIEQAIDAAFGIEKLVHHRYFPAFDQTLAALEVAFFVPNGIIQLIEQLFEFF